MAGFFIALEKAFSLLGVRREGLRDIATCLNAKPEALYHWGFREPVAKSTLADARTAFAALLRRGHYFDAETERDSVFLTNQFKISALTVALIYRRRWRSEMFFRRIKGHLRIKHHYGTNPNAVKPQIWIAITAYLIVAIIHKQLSLPGTLRRTLQLLSVHPLEKAPLHGLLAETKFKTKPSDNSKQLPLSDL